MDFWSVCCVCRLQLAGKQFETDRNFDGKRHHRRFRNGDDYKPRKAILKFFIQIAAALIPVLLGVRIYAVTNPITDQLVRLPEWFSIGVSIIWIVGVTNAVNLIDGLDGLAAGVLRLLRSPCFPSC